MTVIGSGAARPFEIDSASSAPKAHEIHLQILFIGFPYGMPRAAPPRHGEEHTSLAQRITPNTTIFENRNH
jgi:hypothetical protein